MSVWLWILVALGAASALLLLALAVPIDLRLRLEREERTESSVRFSWLFGLVRKEMVGGRTKPEQSRCARKKGKKRRGPSLRALWRSGLLQRGCRLLPRLRRAVSVREFRIRASVNAGDPSETGMAFALIGPVAGLVSAVPGTDVAIVPDFGNDLGVRGELRARVRLVPIVALAPLVVFMLSPATWRGVRHLRTASRS